MSDDREQKARSEDADRRESGEPGGGAGRRETVGESRVFAPGSDDVPADAEVRPAGAWGGGPYEEAGGSELTMHDGELLGGTTAGKDGEPTIDIHGGDRPRDRDEEEDESSS